MSDRPSLAAVVLTYNEAHNIRPCLESLAWAGRRVVLDGGPDAPSNDGTVELARAAGAEVLHHPFQHYAQQRNVALDRVEADWIFFVDADERATPALGDEVWARVVAHRPEVGWWVPRHNYIFGRLTRGGGWYPDYQMRLVRRGCARWERPVHELAVLDGPEGYLEQPLLHYNYVDLADFRARQERYTDLDAAILHHEGIQSHVYTPYTQAVRHFWWRFVTLRGIRDGFHGLRLCLLMAYYEAVKYRKVIQRRSRAVS
jgi:hypothetical protein